MIPDVLMAYTSALSIAKCSMKIVTAVVSPRYKARRRSWDGVEVWQAYLRAGWRQDAIQCEQPRTPGLITAIKARATFDNIAASISSPA
jgi:hypothetical protein